jgi:hypothetical protein
MTSHRDLKDRIRARQRETGESYTAARGNVLREREALLGAALQTQASERCEAVVLKVNERSLRVRPVDGDAHITLRTDAAWKVVPGQIATVILNRRWVWRGDEYAAGRLEAARTDILALSLEPLPLRGGTALNLRDIYDPVRAPDPYARLWRKLTARPRRSFEMDPIAWGKFPGAAPEENPTCDASELAECGNVGGAIKVAMDVLLRDLRCLDAHALLGNLAFNRSSELALLHYDVGCRIGQLSLPADFDGVLLWGELYNRPFLRCLFGYGLCLWRRGALLQARAVFERLLALNPNDNQGARFNVDDIVHERTWEEVMAREARAS